MKRNDMVEQAKVKKAAMDAAGGFLTDEQAAAVPSLYEKWRVGIVVVGGQRLFNEYDSRLYKVNAGMGHTTQADWRPDLAPAMFTVIDVTHAGTIGDPIPAARGMEYFYGLYYLDPEDNAKYLCQREGEISQSVTLHYLPHELVGSYFVKVTE